MTTPSERTWRRNPAALTRETPRSLLISTETSPDPVRVTGIGLALWDALAEPRTTGELTADLDRVYASAGTTFVRELEAALHSLADLGAIVSC